MATAMCGNCYQSLDMETCDVCPNCGRRFRGHNESAETRHLRREFESEVELLNDRVEKLEKWAEKQDFHEGIKNLKKGMTSFQLTTQQLVREMNSRLTKLEEPLKHKNGQPEDKGSVSGDNSEIRQASDQAHKAYKDMRTAILEGTRELCSEPEDKQTVIDKATNLIEILHYQISAIHDGEETALQELRKLLNRVEK